MSKLSHSNPFLPDVLSDDEREDDGCCPGCGACPGFTGVECDGDCDWAIEDAARDPTQATKEL